MIKELVDFGAKNRTIHEALKLESISIDLIIDEHGSFKSFIVIERIFRLAEALTVKKGNARLLLDRAEEVLNYVSPREIKNAKNNIEEAKNRVSRKHNLFLTKLNQYKGLELLKPVFLFYYDNKNNGLDKALSEFEVQVGEKEREGNIAFRINNTRLHEMDEVREAIKAKYENDISKQLNSETAYCSVCGRNKYPIARLHEKIKGLPPFNDGKSSNRLMISYNKDAFLSYGLSQSLNSGICTNCAKNYADALNVLIEKKDSHKIFGSDTAMIYWTREKTELGELDLLDKPDPAAVGILINSVNSVASGKENVSKNLETNRFYSLTLSGAAARIAVRDWIEINLDEYKYNIAKWFEDVRITYYDFDLKEFKMLYPGLNQLSWACNRKDAREEPAVSRVAKYLWSCAIKNQSPPLWILPVVLKRIAYNYNNSEGKSINTFTKSRAALIRLILNRNNKGGIKMKEELDLKNISPAYLCGRLFALIEGIQRSTLGKDINAGVRERFFSAASTSPSPTFGRLMRLMQNHLTKLRQEKPGLAVILDKEVVELCGKIQTFPATLSLEQQGQFALGYYHQKHYNFNCAKQNKEFESLTENMEEPDNE